MAGAFQIGDSYASDFLMAQTLLVREEASCVRQVFSISRRMDSYDCEAIAPENRT
jgi:hypothetical protein